MVSEIFGSGFIIPRLILETEVFSLFRLSMNSEIFGSGFIRARLILETEVFSLFRLSIKQ